MEAPSVEVLDAAPHLSELVDVASRTGEVILTRGGNPVAKIVPIPSVRGHRQPGSARGSIHMADDFDAMPEEFRDYF